MNNRKGTEKGDKVCVTKKKNNNLSSFSKMLDTYYKLENITRIPTKKEPSNDPQNCKRATI